MVNVTVDSSMPNETWSLRPEEDRETGQVSGHLIWFGFSSLVAIELGKGKGERRASTWEHNVHARPSNVVAHTHRHTHTHTMYVCVKIWTFLWIVVGRGFDLFH